MPTSDLTLGTASARVLSAEHIQWLRVIERSKSLSASARELNVVPSTLTYRLQQLEEGLGLQLLNRSQRAVRLTPAATLLLEEGERLVHELQALSQRAQRVASGWEAQFTIALDSALSMPVILELSTQLLSQQPPTRLRLRHEALSGTLSALTQGVADLAIGVSVTSQSTAQIMQRPLGAVRFRFVAAPHHPLARQSAQEKSKISLSDEQIFKHRVIVVADSIQQGPGIDAGIGRGKDWLTVPDMHTKCAAIVQGLGIGYLPSALALPFIKNAQLVELPLQRPLHQAQMAYAWRTSHQGFALDWWRQKLESPVTQAALLGSGSAGS